MAKARKILDWDEQIKLAIDPELAKNRRSDRNLRGEVACSMCGNYCAVKILGEYLDKKISPCND